MLFERKVVYVEAARVPTDQSDADGWRELSRVIGHECDPMAPGNQESDPGTWGVSLALCADMDGGLSRPKPGQWVVRDMRGRLTIYGDRFFRLAFRQVPENPDDYVAVAP